MDKAAVYRYLTQQGISYEVTEHSAMFHMGELAAAGLPYPEWDAKNLFVRDGKRRHYCLITVKGDKRVDLKSFRRQYRLHGLSFASPEELLAILGLTPGSVSPLGLLADHDRRVHFYLDAEFAGNKIGIHPNDNTATVWMAAEDLMALLRRHGTQADYIPL